MAVAREEERLGAFSLLSHLRRIMRFAAGHRGMLWLLVFLSMVQAGLEISLPQVVRGGIDHYILPAWVRIDTSRAGDWLIGDAERLVPADDGRHVFVRRLELLDAERHALEARELIGPQGWYLLPGREGGTARFISDEDFRELPAAMREGLRADDLDGILWLAGLYLLLLLVNFGLNYTVTYGLNRLGQQAVLAMRGKLWRRLQRLPVSYFDANPVGRLVTRVTNDTANLSDLFASVVASAVSDVVLFGGILTLLLVMDPATTLVLIALAPLIFFLAWWFKRVSQAIYREVRVQVARFNTFLQESVTGVSVVRAFIRERAFIKKFAGINLDYYLIHRRLINIYALFRPMIDAFSTVAAGLVVWYAGGEVLRQQMSVGTVVAFLLYLKMLFMPLQDLAEKFNILQSSLVSSERLLKILDTPAEPSGDGRTAGAEAPELIFDGVTFGYDPAKPVLHDVSFTVPAGSKVALVGPTGAGKTTVAALLLGLYPLQADQGRVLVGGRAVSDWDVQELRRRFSLIQQDLFLFSGSLEENIGLFEPLDDDRLAEALAASRAKKLVERLPDGLAYQLNERGTVLSQGERQLVSFARALARGGPILILDEATSSIDSANEALIQEALADLMQDRTALIVAHRLSTVRAADHILVLHGGRIVEQGNHADLLAADGLYAHLVHTQLASTSVRR